MCVGGVCLCEEGGVCVGGECMCICESGVCAWGGVCVRVYVWGLCVRVYVYVCVGVAVCVHTTPPPS